MASRAHDISGRYLVVVMVVIALLFAKLCAPILEPNFNSSLLEVYVGGELLAQSDIGVLSLIENCLQLG